MVPVLSHPPYSPDLSPPDYFLLPKLKMDLEGDHFVSIDEIQEAVTTKLNFILKEGFLKGMKRLNDRANMCITSNGDYFE